MGTGKMASVERVSFDNIVLVDGITRKPRRPCWHLDDGYRHNLVYFNSWEVGLL